MLELYPEYRQEAPPEPKIDMAVVAFYNKNQALILYVNTNSGIYWDMEGVGQDVVEGLLDDNSPDHGIWIWEGKVTWTVSYEGDGDCDYTTHQWRAPTSAEWRAMRAGRNPLDKLSFMTTTTVKTAWQRFAHCLYWNLWGRWWRFTKISIPMVNRKYPEL